MSPEAWLLLAAVVTAVGGVITTWLMIRQQGRQTKTTDSQQIIDQLQEMRAADEDRHRQEKAEAEERHQREIAEVRGEVHELRTRVTRMEDRELASFDYIYTLRAHIDQRRDPPPPAWPPALMHRT